MACPSIILGGVTLSPHLLWVDEFAFQPVVQSVKRTLGGGFIAYTGGLVGGRPITLASEDDQGWLPRTQVDALQAMADIPGNVMQLLIGIQTFSVIFRHEEPPAFRAEPLIFRVDAPAGDYFLVNIKLARVA